jgi:hypothetical protein
MQKLKAKDSLSKELMNAIQNLQLQLTYCFMSLPLFGSYFQT